eukprot:jgi/Bigna1/145331/aug1.98_g20039
MLNSGIAKLRERCPKWLTLSAMKYHFETQPMPTWVAYYLHALPPIFHQAATAATLFLELIVPFFLITPFRGLWVLAFLSFSALSLMIHISGNVGIFNALTIVLSLAALDDVALGSLSRRAFPAAAVQRRLERLFLPKSALMMIHQKRREAGGGGGGVGGGKEAFNLLHHHNDHHHQSFWVGMIRKLHLGVVCGTLFPLLVGMLLPMLSLPISRIAGQGLLQEPVLTVPQWALKLYINLLPTWLGQVYSPFSRIVTYRWELKIEGLAGDLGREGEGGEWHSYRFHFRKENDDDEEAGEGRGPGLFSSFSTMPHTNTGHEWRIDQQMQSLGSNLAEGQPLPEWFQRMLRLLLHNSEHLTSALARNPFKGKAPPKALRLSLMDAHFTSCRLDHNEGERSSHLHDGGSDGLGAAAGYSYPEERRRGGGGRKKWWWRGKVKDLFDVALVKGRLVPASKSSVPNFYKYIRSACELRCAGGDGDGNDDDDVGVATEVNFPSSRLRRRKHSRRTYLPADLNSYAALFAMMRAAPVVNYKKAGDGNCDGDCNDDDDGNNAEGFFPRIITTSEPRSIASDASSFVQDVLEGIRAVGARLAMLSHGGLNL